MSKLDKIIVLVAFIAALYIFAGTIAETFRWDMESGASYHTWKMNRFTGQLWTCNLIECSEVPNVSE